MNGIVKKNNDYCFGCGEKNDKGLHLTFHRGKDAKGEFIKSIFSPKPELCGYQTILHGGIQALLLDEVTGCAASEFLGKRVTTEQIDIQFRKPLPISQTVYAIGRLLLSDDKTVVVWGELSDQNGDVYTYCKAKMRVIRDNLLGQFI